MNKKRNIIIAVIAVVVVAVAMVGIYLATRPATAAGAKEITVEVVHADESTVSFTYHTDAEYLGEVLLAEKLVEGEQGDYGLYILTVDGETADYDVDGAYWALMCNGEYSTTGADTTPVQDGDSFQLVYTK